MSDERMQILRMIEEKRITPNQGVELLEALSIAEEGISEQIDIADSGVSEPQLSAAWMPVAEDESPEETTEPSAAPPDFSGFRHLWLIPLAAGGLLSAIGVGLFVLVQAISAGSFFLICGVLPTLLGLAIILLAFWSRTARWLHVRVRGEQRISLSFPLPLRLAGWLLHLVRPLVPQLEEMSLDEVILSLDESLATGGGFYVDVQDGQDGEQVQVYIG